jgi:ABC-type sugar transport system ATPase subunit
MKMARIGELKNNNIILEIQSLSKIYPGTVALKNTNIKFRRSEVHGIIGKNGAGKSTLVNILSGIIPPSIGKIIINGKEFRSLTPEIAKSEGITIVTQKPEVIMDFTVVQNLFLPQYKKTKIKILKWKEMFAEAKNIFSNIGLNIDLNRKMGDLSLSEQQIFLIIKAFYFEKKDIVILDEVSSSFSRKEQDFIFNIINNQKEEGKLIIFISHRIDEVFKICDRVTVIRDAMVVETIGKNDLNEEKLCFMIVGEKTNGSNKNTNERSFPYIKENLNEKRQAKSKETILSIEGFSKKGFFKNINFDLKKNEILGLAGLVGSGRTEILKAISGIEPAENGWIILENGGKNRFLHSWDSLKKGIVYLTENRDKEGLISILSVKINLTLSYFIRLIGKSLFINNNKEKNLIAELINDFEIKTHSQEEVVENLSGGNRQKVLFGRIFSTKAKVFLLDEPTKGIDIATKLSILRMIKSKISQSAGVIITSPGVEDLLTVCDRILVLFKGEITYELERKDFNELKIYSAMQGLNK